MALTLERVAADSADALRLMEAMWAEVDQLYGNTGSTPFKLAGMDDSRAAFVIAHDASGAVGCAALRPLAKKRAEIKRMYVAPAARRKGVAREMMRALEEIARESGFSEIWLETGLRQPAAIQLYESLGYKRIAAFGDYKDDPMSICFGKTLI